MKRAHPHELNEDASPAIQLRVSEERLRELFPVRFRELDAFSEAEPSIGALVRIDTGALLVVVFGTATKRAMISVPVSANVHDSLSALLSEAPIFSSEVTWVAEDAGDLAFARRAAAR